MKCLISMLFLLMLSLVGVGEELALGPWKLEYDATTIQSLVFSCISPEYMIWCLSTLDTWVPEGWRGGYGKGNGDSIDRRRAKEIAVLDSSRND